MREADRDKGSTCILCSIDGEGDAVCGVLHSSELEEEAAVLTGASVHPVLQRATHRAVAAAPQRKREHGLEK